MRVLAVALILVVSSVAALAEVPPGKEGNLAEFLPPRPGERICFARTYDAAHLAKHPKQTVSLIKFSLAYYRHEPDEFHKEGQRDYYFRLEVRQRSNKGKALTTVGDCFPGKGVIHCNVECDGGGIQVKWRDKPNSILIDLAATGRIRLDNCGGEENAVELEPGADDRTFLLSRLAPAACPRYETW
jgi:hypothetical protein